AFWMPAPNSSTVHRKGSRTECSLLWWRAIDRPSTKCGPGLKIIWAVAPSRPVCRRGYGVKQKTVAGALSTRTQHLMPTCGLSTPYLKPGGFGRNPVIFAKPKLYLRWSRAKSWHRYLVLG